MTENNFLCVTILLFFVGNFVHLQVHLKQQARQLETSFNLH